MSSFKKHLVSEFSKCGEGTKDEMVKKATIFFNKELSPYFSSLYGDRWVLLTANPKFKLDWVTHLVGISPSMAAKAVDKMCREGKTQFIPSPLEFRSLCLEAKSEERKSKLKIVRDE